MVMQPTPMDRLNIEVAQATSRFKDLHLQVEPKDVRCTQQNKKDLQALTVQDVANSKMLASPAILKRIVRLVQENDEDSLRLAFFMLFKLEPISWDAPRMDVVAPA